jgi:hypothetical protein
VTNAHFSYLTMKGVGTPIVSYTAAHDSDSRVVFSILTKPGLEELTTTYTLPVRSPQCGIRVHARCHDVISERLFNRYPIQRIVQRAALT